MAAYPPPLIQSDIFNSALFSEATTAVVSSGDPSPTTEYVDFPEPQGELTFLNGTGVRTTISASAVTLFQNIGISEDGVGFNATGIAYQPPDAAPVAITWNNLATKVEAIAAITQASDATTLNVNNSIQIQNGETQSEPTQYITIKSDNSGNRISLDGSYGEVGQVILSGGENGSLSWGAGGGGGSQDLQQVLDVGNTANRTIFLTNSVGLGSQSSFNDNSITFVYDNGINNKSIDIGAFTPAIVVSDRTLSTLDQERCSITPTELSIKTNPRFTNTTPAPTTTITKSIMTIDDGALNGDNKKVEIEPTGITISEFDNSVLTNSIEITPTTIAINNAYGTAGQVLTSGGSAGTLSWADGGGGSQDLQQVLDISNVAVDTSIISSLNTFFTTTISGTGVSMLDATNGIYDYQSNNINYAANTISNTKADGFFLYEEYSNVATNQSTTLQHQDGFVGAPPNVPNVVAKCEITTQKVELNSYTNGEITTTSILSPYGLSVSVPNSENPAPANLINIDTISIKQDQNDANDTKTTTLGLHSLSFQQIYQGVSKDILQMDTTSLKMYNNGEVQTNLVELKNVDDLNGLLTLRSSENGNRITLSNNELIFSDIDNNNWSITQSTDTANNLTISQTGTAGYMDLNFNELLIRGGAGTAGQVLTSGGTNGNFTWETPSSGWIGTATSNLDMGTYDITSTSGTLDISATNIEITGQANFVSPPHIPEPILGNDAASKGYVDSLVGQYSGGFNLFLNYSVTDPTFNTFKELTALVDNSPTEVVQTNLTTNLPFLLSQFITAPLNITEIPVGLWDLFLFALINATQDSTTAYFELWKRPATGEDVLLGTSGTSGDINNTNNPTSYSMVLTISTAIPLLLTDRLYIKIFGQTTHNNTIVLTTFYEGNDYSFIQTTLNAGTTLLSSNNNWTGTNNFSINPTTPSKTTPANTDIINYADIQRLSTPIVSTLEYYISTLSPFFQYPPQPPTAALINSYQYYGWYFINSVVARKIDWFFAPDYQMTVADVKGLYMNYFNVTTTSNDNCPFISIYTKPTGTNDVIPGFAHSVNTFVPTFTPIAASPFCSFMNISGTQQDPFPYGHILGSMAQSTVNNPRGEYLPTEEVLAIAVGSASGSALNQCAFIMSKVGICLEQGNQELILNPQNILEQPTLSTVLALGSAAGNQSITGVNNLAATSVTTPTLANGAATLTVGTVGQITNIVGTLQNNGAELPAYISSSGVASGSIDMNSNSITECNSLDSVSSLTLGGTTALGVNVGRAAQTTDLLGNVRVNGSSGASGEVLTSTGASTAPTFQALPTPYISTSGVASGAINMNTNAITSCTRLDSASALALGNTTATGVSVGRLTQTTDLVGNVRINGSSGLTGQALISTGASTAPTWQPLAVNTTYYQTIDTSVTLGGGSSLRAKLTFNVPTSTATYLFSFSAIGGPDNTSGVGGQTFTTFTYEKGTSTSFTGSRNMIGNALANVALTNQTSVSAVVNGPTGTYNALSGQRIYTVSTGTSFVAGDYSFCLLVYNAGPANIRQMTFSAIQLTA